MLKAGLDSYNSTRNNNNPSVHKFYTLKSNQTPKLSAGRVEVSIRYKKKFMVI